MSMTILTLGHGGGVPVVDPITKKSPGNTNFAVMFGPLVHEPPFFTDEAMAGWLQNPYWLVDCGPETVQDLVRWDVIKNLQGIFITHCHADHSGGLSSLAWRCKFIEKIKPRLIVGDEMTLDVIDMQTFELHWPNWTAYVESGTWMLDDFFEVNRCFVSLAATPSNVDWQFIKADHNIPDERFPCFSLRLGDGMHKVFFSGDTAVPSVPPDVDLILHDVQFYADPGDETTVHCPYSKLKAAVPENQRDNVVMAHTVQAPPTEALEMFRWACRYSVFHVG